MPAFRLPVLSLLLVLTAGSLAAWAEDDPLARGDAAWARRAEGHQGGQAAAGPIDAALAAYEAAYKTRPQDLDGYWKLLRALHYKGEYVARTPQEKQAAFGRGRGGSEAALGRLAGKVGGRARLNKMSPAETAKALAGVPHAIDVFLWGGVDWGLWGEAFGKVA